MLSSHNLASSPLGATIQLAHAPPGHGADTLSEHDNTLGQCARRTHYWQFDRRLLNVHKAQTDEPQNLMHAHDKTMLMIQYAFGETPCTL